MRATSFSNRLQDKPSAEAGSIYATNDDTYRMLHSICSSVDPDIRQKVNCSEVDAELGTQYQRVPEMARAVGLNDVLKVGLDEKRALSEIEAIGQFHDGLVILALGRTRKLAILLGSLQLFTEVTGRDRQSEAISGLLILAHPEAKELIGETKPEKVRKTSPSWQRFIENRQLLSRYNVTDRELRTLEHLSCLGTVISAKEFLAILTLIRDIPSNK